MGACPGLAQWTSIIVCHTFLPDTPSATYCRDSHGALIVVITVPLLSYTLHFLYASEDVRVKNSPSVTAVESFYISVLGRISRPGIQNTHIVSLALFLKILWNELRAVITFDVFRLAIQLNYLSQCLYYPSCRERHRNLLGHRHLIAVIHYVQYSELPSALQDITHKIQRPCRIGLRWLSQRCLDTCWKAFLQTDTFLVVHILVYTVNLLVFPLLTFTPETFEYLPETWLPSLSLLPLQCYLTFPDNSNTNGGSPSACTPERCSIRIPLQSLLHLFLYLGVKCNRACRDLFRPKGL